MGRFREVGIATCYGLDRPGIDPVSGEIFHTRPDLPWGSPRHLYNGYRVFPEGKAAGCGVDHTPPTGAEVKGRAELYL